ncbi:extracellular solute-binding protein [Marinimicrobium alkaliphilum]|uniref:extracellular solute-binding protein n=1 Tax=Marinimicrobium alkaliphilum TaxID=2202654 RepID=UPI000DBA2F7B|nr:extracellular solute-binding protein [Marinimicrobium alkaliphilum]
MKTTAWLSLWLVLLALPGCSRQDENALVIYSAGPRPLIEQIAADFSAAHDIPVRLFVATTGQLMAKLEAERFRPQADVVIFASDVAAEALRHGKRLAPLADLPLPETHTDWHDPNGYYLATSAALVGVALASSHDAVQPDWPLLFSGDFPGRIAMPSPSRSGTAGDFVVNRVLTYGDDAWTEFTRARSAGMEFPAANSQALTSLMIGNYQAVLGAVDYLVFRQMDQGASITFHYPASGVPLITRPVGILASSPRQDSARLFIEFLFTTEVQQQVARQHLMPARTDIAQSETRQSIAPPEKITSRDVALALNEQGRILRRFQYGIERAQVTPASDRNSAP